MHHPVLSIDISKSQSYAAAFLSFGQPYQRPTKFQHTPEGLSSLLDCLSRLELKTGKKPQVVLEATGNYSKPIISFFQQYNYQVVVLNPVLYKFYSKKLSEGKPSKVAIVAASSKLLRIIYGIWASKQPFTM